MATYSSNTTMKVSAAISADNTYSVPANSYAIVQVFMDSMIGNESITVGGRVVWTATAGFGQTVFPSAVGTAANPYAVTSMTLYVGPGQTITKVGTGNLKITGVQFINTP